MANFFIDGTRFLLTWSQAGVLTKPVIRDVLKGNGAIKYCVICEEKHLDGNKHFHALVIYERRLKRRVNVFTIDRCICNVKNLKTQADVKRALKYVKKDGDYDEIGIEPDYCKKLDKGEKVKYILENDERNCALSGYFNFSELARISFIKNMCLEKWPAWKKRNVMWFWGETGSGKTRNAREQLLAMYDDVWMSSGKLDMFFNGYHGQKAAILDDFRPGVLRFDMLLRILDGYPVTVNVKGSVCEWLAETIIITAPVEPCDMFINRETGQEWDHLDQLLRRIDLIRKFP